MVTDTDILKYLEGKCTDAEAQLLEAWISSDSANTKYFEEYKAIFNASETIADYKEVDIDQEWESFQSSNIIEKSNQAVTLNIDNDGKSSGRIIKYMIAASLAALVAAFFAYSNIFDSTDAPAAEVYVMELKTISTENLNETVTLSDNSIVELSEQTEIQFPSSFENEESRVVKLISGSASFDIAHDPNKKFEVTCNDVGIEVLGTEFTLSTVGDKKEVSIDLISGSLKAFQLSDINNKIILKPGDKVSFTNQSFTKKAQPEIKKEEVQVKEEKPRPILEPTVVKETIEAPTPPEKTKSSGHQLVDVLKFLDKKHGKKIKLERRLKYDKTLPVDIDFHQSDLEAIISDIERLTSLKAKKGKCDGCYIITSGDK